MRALSSARELPTYLLIGALAALVYFGCLYALIDVVSLPSFFAVSISYTAAVATHFFGNQKLTFRASRGGMSRQLWRYLVMLLLNYAITVATVFVAVNGYDMNVYVGAMVGIVLTTALGFVFSKYWVFRQEACTSAGQR